ncbi:RNA methyltransferase [Oscillospiraceae bacterium HV4-5-C5C]|nr:RNA methyltransferase [Oscillospiraceae bacterium HV4-5-C5C]
MLNIINIKDYQDPRLDWFARLTEARLRAAFEQEQGIFIAESPNVVRLALTAGYEPLALLMEEQKLAALAALLQLIPAGLPVYTASRDLLQGLTGYALTRGVLAAFKRKALPQAAAICQSASRIAVLENITDAANVGAIIRSAAGLGVDAVLLTPSCCDPLGRRAVRVSMGTVFQLPWARIGRRADDWPAAGLRQLRQQGFTTLAMALRPDGLSLDQPELRRIRRLAIVLGTEGSGLARQTIADCDYSVRIPMSHGVDSLNVAAASAVAFWQLRPALVSDPCCGSSQTVSPYRGDV